MDSSARNLDAPAVSVSVASLLGLAHAARGLSLRRNVVRARHSDVRRSPFKGRGMEYDESRPYQPGDDVRHLDWRVTARTGKAHTKLFREERERPVFLWVDYRAPMFFATRGRFKSVVAAQVAALLAWSAVHEGDRLGSVVFNDSEHSEIKPQRGKTGALRLFHELAHLAGAGGDAVAEHAAAAAADTAAETADDSRRAPSQALSRLAHIARRGSLIFLISDFRGLDETAQTRLLQLAAHSETMLAFVCDPLERRLPPPGRYRVSDGRRDLEFDAGDARLAADYAAAYAKRVGLLRAFARKAGVGFLQCRTDDEPLAVLQRHFGTRRR